MSSSSSDSHKYNNDLECNDLFLNEQLKELDLECSVDNSNFELNYNVNEHNTDFDNYLADISSSQQLIDGKNEAIDSNDQKYRFEVDNCNNTYDTLKEDSDINESGSSENPEENDPLDQIFQSQADDFNETYISTTKDSNVNEEECLNIPEKSHLEIDMETQSKGDHSNEKMDDVVTETSINTESDYVETHEENELSPIKNEDLKITEEKTKVVKKFGVQMNLTSNCHVCAKRVYPLEQIIMDLKCYHKGCFKCQKCGKILSPAAASRLNGNVFCKPHYIELFRKRGRYEDICISNDNANEAGVSTLSHIDQGRSTDSGRLSKDGGASFAAYGCVSGDVPRDYTDYTVRKAALDSDSCSRVADTRKAWVEGRLFNREEWKKGNSNNNNNTDFERRRLNSRGSIRDIAALFESNQQ